MRASIILPGTYVYTHTLARYISICGHDVEEEKGNVRERQAPAGYAANVIMLPKFNERERQGAIYDGVYAGLDTMLEQGARDRMTRGSRAGI